MSKPQLNTRVLTDFKYRPFIQTQETEVMIIVLVAAVDLESSSQFIVVLQLKKDQIMIMLDSHMQIKKLIV